MENQKDDFYEWLENLVRSSQYDGLASENFLNEEWESPVNFDLPEWGDFFKGLPEYVPCSECGREKCICAKEQCSQTQDKNKRKRALEEANTFPTQNFCIVAPSPQKKRSTLTVRVNMPRFGIHNVDSMVEVNGSDKVIVLREKLRDIARTKRLKFPLNECFFIHLQDGINGHPYHIPLVNHKLSFERAGVIRDGSIILTVSPCFAYLHPDTQLHLFCRDCAPSSKKS